MGQYECAVMLLCFCASVQLLRHQCSKDFGRGAKFCCGKFAPLLRRFLDPVTLETALGVHSGEMRPLAGGTPKTIEESRIRVSDLSEEGASSIRFFENFMWQSDRLGLQVADPKTKEYKASDNYVIPRCLVEFYYIICRRQGGIKGEGAVPTQNPTQAFLTNLSLNFQNSKLPAVILYNTKYSTV